MPLRNRVTPQGWIEAVAARGTLMGNRGILHDKQGAIGRSLWKHKRWIVCEIEFRGRNRKPMMRQGRYTELFFLDEAVALAAGHRPCKQCRRIDFEAYAAAWRVARPNGDTTPPKAGEIDDVLHVDRLGADRRPARHKARLGDLAAGCFVVLPQWPDEAWLVWNHGLHRWTHRGYDEKRAICAGDIVSVLTPRASVAVLSAGYRPRVHATAG